MGLGKRKKIAALHEFNNVYQNFSFEQPQLFDSTKTEIDYRGTWRKEAFKNDHPLIVEVACGKGDYTLKMAELFPEKNHIGVDIKGPRIYTGAKDALERKLDNVAFVRTNIMYLDRFFGTHEIDELWITFPDPFPRKSAAKHRLTSPGFLSVYEKCVKQDGLVHLKTDDINLFRYSAETIKEEGFALNEYMEDIYSKEELPPILKINTHYERQHLENKRTINYLNYKNTRHATG